MEKFMKDTAMVKAAKNISGDSLKSQILCDARLMNELHVLGFADTEVDGYISLLATYLDQRDAEEDPTRTKIAPYPGMSMKLIIDDSGHLSFVVGPNQENKNRMLLEANFLYRDYPDEWMKLNLGAVKQARFRKVQKAIGTTRLQRPGAKRWAYIQGESGTGKTMYLAAFANEQALVGKTVCFMDANIRFDELKDAAIKNRDQFIKNMEALKSCDILIIDDFGNGFKSEYVRDQIVMPLLNDRSKSGLNTYFTSQYSIYEIEQLYAGRGNPLEGKKIGNIIRKNIAEEIYLDMGIENVGTHRKSH